MRKFERIIILGAGTSSRLWPLRKKMFLPFVGRSFLEHLLTSLTPYSGSFILIANQETKKNMEEIVKKLSKKLNIATEIVVQRSDIPGLGGAVASLGAGVSGEAVVVNSGDYFQASHLEVLRNTSEVKNPDHILSVIEVTKYYPGGYLEIKGEQLVGIQEKPGSGHEPSNKVKLVVDYIADIEEFTKLITELKVPDRDLYEVAINEYIKRGKKVEYTVYKGPFFPLKYPWHVLPAMAHFLKSVKDYRDKSAKISDTAIIEGDVYIGPRVTIGDYSKIVGPAYIGEGSVIGDYSLVRESQIGEKTVVGGYCEVARSYVGDHVMLHRNYVGDSILADHVMMGSGGVTANFRFDAENVSSQVGKEKLSTDMKKLGAVVGAHSKIGVNVTILPGIKIGAGSFVSPGETVWEDVPDNSYFKENKIVENKKNKS